MSLQNSTEEKFIKFYEELADPIFRHCFFRVSSRELAKDIVQETFTRVWQYLADGKEISNMKAFLYTTTNNLIIDYYRKRRESSLETMEESGFNPSDSSHEVIVKQAEISQATKLLNELDEPHRSAAIMRYIDGFSPKEIAEITKESENVISVRLHRALQKIKERMANS